MSKKRLFNNWNQLSFSFAEGHARAARWHVSREDRMRAFWFLVGCSLLCLIVYVYAVNATAHHVAERSALEAASTELSADIAGLEFKYIALQNQVTPDLAAQYGFTEVKEPLYVSRQSARSLSLNAAKP